jgi:peptidoglycan/LPS O-acetylase OafA/YrhL
MANRNIQRQDIQELRGISVLAVILFHASKNNFEMGYLGVDVFFVISGFVVTPRILDIFNSNQKPGNKRVISKLYLFYKKRFYRLAPALASSLILTSILFLLFINIDEHKSLARQGLSAIFIFGNFNAYKYNGEYFATNTNPLLHTWSLSVEEQIYLALPLILAIFYSITKKVYTFVYILLGALSFSIFIFAEKLYVFYSKIGIELISQFSFYSPIDRFWQFSIGGLAFILTNKKGTNSSGFFKKIIILVFLLTLLFIPTELSFKMSSIMVCFASALVIHFKSVEVLPFVIRQQFKFLGDRSYSIYLVHMPLIHLINHSDPISGIFKNSSSALVIFAKITISVVIGTLNYSLIEKRFRNIPIRKVRVRQSQIVAPILLASIFTLALMFVGPDKRYWGLERNEKKPINSFSISQDCRIFGTDIYEPCLLNRAPSKSSVLLIGDSQAASISETILETSKELNFNYLVWTGPSCQFNIKRTNRTDSTPCARQNHRIFEYIKSNRPNVIVIGQFVNSTSNLSELSDSVREISLYSKYILMMENVPMFPDTNDYMVRRPFLSTPYNAPKFYNVDKMIRDDKRVSDKLASLVKRDSIKTLNPQDTFCNSVVCNRFQNQEWLYFDPSHLSLAGAKLLKPEISEYLSNSLSRQKTK